MLKLRWVWEGCDGYARATDRCLPLSSGAHFRFAAANSCRARPSGLVQVNAAAGFQWRAAAGAANSQAMPALRRCHDLRISHTACDRHQIEDGLFTWDYDIPPFVPANPGRSPLDFHDNNQVRGSPFFEDDQVLLKFNCFWTIELPRGFSLFVTHPINRIDLPFHTLTGVVDSDLYRDNFINFPARWMDPQFSGVLGKGTPVAQCIPIRREDWVRALRLWVKGRSNE
jgi:hypothetical protein